MKKNALTLFLIVLSLTYLFAQYKSESFSDAQKTGKATMSVHYFDVPFFSQNKNGAVTGINRDILEDFVKWVKAKKNIDITARYEDNSSDFKSMYDGIKGGDGLVVGVGAIAGTDERRREIGVTKAYLTLYNVLASQSNVPTLEKMEDAPQVFKGLTGYSMKASKMEEAMMGIKKKFYPEMPIKSYSSINEYVTKLVSDKQGFGYLMLPNYIEALKSGKTVKRHAVGDTEPLPICFLLPKGSDWLAVFDEFLSADGGYTNSQRFRSILIKHMGETGVKLLKIGA